MNKELKELELLEFKYLKKYFHFLKFTEDEILYGLNSKNKIKNEWWNKWNISDNHKISDFNIGAERVIYALINSKGIGTPNSCPVGSDLMFEVDDAFIHIDLKTVQTTNIGDFSKNIFVGNNQISYNSTYEVDNDIREYNFANLPTKYNVYGKQKYCLTYFISILHDTSTLETLCIDITSFPNGLLQPIYKGDVFKAGKNPDKVRYNFQKCLDFRLLGQEYRRLLVIYMNKNINQQYVKTLNFINQCYNSQNFPL